MSEARTLQGRHVLAALLGFFAIVVGVNLALTWLAVESHPGLVSEEPYRRGLAYNRVLEARRAQEQLGWQVRIQGPDNSTRAAVAEFRDAAGEPLSGLIVTGRLIRPSDPSRDATFAFSEMTPGRYQVEIAAFEPGRWRLAIEARRSGESSAIWQMERDL